MTVNSRYTDSESEINTKNSEPWRPIGQLVKSLRQKSVAAMNNGLFEVAEEYHAQSIEAEVGE